MLVRFGEPMMINKGECPEVFTKRLRVQIAELEPADYRDSLPAPEDLPAAQPQHMFY